MDSIAGKFNTLKENLKGILTSNVTTDMFKGLLDGANKVVEAVGKISSSLGKIGSAGALVGISSFVKTLSNLDKAKTIGGGFTGFDNLLEVIQGTAVTSSGEIKTLGDSFKELGVKTTLSKVALGLFKGVLMGIAFTAVVKGIDAMVKAWDNYIHATENAVKASKERQDGYRDEAQTLSTKKSNLQEIAKEYDNLNNKSDKTAEDLTRLNELKQQIGQIAPDLVKGYDSAGNPILNLTTSMQGYIAELDKAIAKQQELYNYETKKQAREYMKKNDTKNGAQDPERNSYETELNHLQNANDRKTREEKRYTGSLKNIIKDRNKYREDQEKSINDRLERIRNAQTEVNNRDTTIEDNYVNEFNKKTKLAEKEQNKFATFMKGLNWGTYGEAEANRMAKGLQTLSEKTAFTTQEMTKGLSGSMSKKVSAEIAKVNAEFKKTNAINEWGKNLRNIANETGKFDFSNWSNYLSEVQTRFEQGVSTNEQYTHSLGIMADAMEDLTGIDSDVFLPALKGGADLEEAFKSATEGLNGFMSAYGSSTAKLQQGDSFAKKLESQFKELENFETEFEGQYEMEGKVRVDWLVEQKDNEDLPKQLRTIIDAVTKDGKVTEVEEKLVLACETEIKDKGKLEQSTIDAINQVMDGTWDVNKTIEIGGMEFTSSEIRELMSLADQLGISLEGLNIGDTGLDGEAQKAQALKDAIDSISDREIKVAIEAEGFENSDQVNNIMSVVDQIDGRQAKVDFIADASQYFMENDNVESAIKAMPDEIKLKYNIGVEGDERLEGIQSRLEKLPKDIRTMVYAQTYGVENVEMLEKW